MRTHVHSGFDMPNPTLRDLVDRLRVVLSDSETPLTLEELAGHPETKLKLSTINRWRAGDTEGYARLIELFRLAGWLAPDALQNHGPMAQPEAVDEAIGRVAPAKPRRGQRASRRGT